MSRCRYKILAEGYPYFFTCTVVNWLPIFSNPQIAQIVLDSLVFMQREKRLILYAYVSMENHLHLIAQAEALSKEIASFKSFTARSMVDFYIAANNHFILDQLAINKREHKRDRIYQVWQEGSHPQQIIDERMLRQKMEYIHYNPVRRGYVELPQHWRYSSAGNYVNGDGLIPVNGFENSL